MRFLAIMYPGAKADLAVPSPEAIAEMMKFNEALSQAGVLLSLDGLHPPANGVRIRFDGKKRTIHDGPFSEAKEVIGGYWILQVRSKEEAVEWMSRCPAGEGEMIELRQVFEMEEFNPDENLKKTAARLEQEMSDNKKRGA
ncbi:MAG: YciI family protein [Myxococcota bacterium]